jgi:hypothetical protein
MSFTSSRVRIVIPTAVLVVAVASLLVARPADAQGDVHVFWPAASTKSQFFDFGREGLRLGDRLASRGPLLDASQVDQVGFGSQDCIVVKHITDGSGGPGGMYRCSYILRLEAGDLLVEGLDPHGPGVYVLSVVGGTEAYAGASGDATLNDIDEGTDFVINLA